MAAGDNMMDLALKITADPSQAVAAIKEVNATAQAMQRTIAQSLQQQGATAEEAAQIYKQMGINGAQAGAEIKAAFGEATAASQVAGETAAAANGNIYEMLTSLRRFRMIFATTIGLASFGFWVNEWARLAGYLGDALQKMEGIHTAQNDIAMSQAFQALKQITEEEKKQLLQPHSARMAGIYQHGIELRIQTLQRLKDEAAALDAGSLAGEKYAKAMADIAAHSREFGLQGPAASVVQSLEKQIQAYRAIMAVEQEYEEKQTKTAHAHAAGVNHAARAQERLAAEQGRFQFGGTLFNLGVGTEFTRRQTGIAQALSAQRYADLKSALAAYQSFEKTATSEEARSRAESARQEQQYLRTTETNMRRHVQTMLALQKEISSGGSYAGVSFRALGQTFDQFNAGLRQASQISGIAIEPITRLRFELMKVRESADMVGLSFQGFTKDIGQNAAAAIVYGSNFGKALEQATKATLAQVAAQSFIWGLYYTAHGIADIFWNPPRAVADFAAAGDFFAIGGISAGVGAAIPGGGGSAAAAASAPARGVQPGRGLSGSQGVAGNEGAPGGAGGSVDARRQIFVNLYGGQITDTHNLQDLIDAMNQGGQGGTVRLNIAGGSHTIPNPIY